MRYKTKNNLAKTAYGIQREGLEVAARLSNEEKRLKSGNGCVCERQPGGINTEVV